MSEQGGLVLPVPDTYKHLAREYKYTRKEHHPVATIFSRKRYMLGTPSFACLLCWSYLLIGVFNRCVFMLKLFIELRASYRMIVRQWLQALGR